MARILILGGGPAGYESALVAAQFGAQVTLVEPTGPGGSCVLYDCVPSKTFIASAGGRTAVREASRLGVQVDDDDITMNVDHVHDRVRSLAAAQSADIGIKLENAGVEIVPGRARFADAAVGLAVHHIEVELRVRRDRGPGGGRGADRHRRQPAGARQRGAGRRTDPRLAAGLLAAGTAVSTWWSSAPG